MEKKIDVAAIVLRIALFPSTIVTLLTTSPGKMDKRTIALIILGVALFLAIATLLLSNTAVA